MDLEQVPHALTDQDVFQTSWTKDHPHPATTIPIEANDPHADILRGNHPGR